MEFFRCDGCGAELKKGALRYKVDINIHAAYDEIEIGLADLVRDHRAEMVALLERLRHRAPKDIEEEVYKRMMLDLCPACQKAYIQDPLHFHPEQGSRDEEIDIDGFLRSLGVNQKEGDAGET